jgi:hypothetical protein
LTADAASGAYGFRLRGLDGAHTLLAPVPAGWPTLEILCRPAVGPGPPGDSVTADRVELRLQTGGWVLLDRMPLRAAFHLQARPDDGALVHPYLAPVAAMAARWVGRDSFHAGAVVIDGGAWALVGDKGSGKSSTLAHLALSGYEIVTDDVLILEEGEALAGPRCVDLRPEPAAELGVGTPLGVIGQRARWRMELGPPTAPRLPLRGWVRLEWHDRVEVGHVRGAQRLTAVDQHRAVRLPASDPRGLLDVSALPVLELRRPQRWTALSEAADRLLSAITG